MNRRSLLKGLASFSALGLGTASYATIIEPGFRLRTQAYAFTPNNWTPGLKLRLAVFSDLHCVHPWMQISRFEKIVEALNAMNPDLILGLGDYVAALSSKFRTGTVPTKDIAKAAAALKAPLGVYSINGNHDWWDDKTAIRNGFGPPLLEQEFEAVGIKVLSNKATKLSKGGKDFWLMGTDSTLAFVPKRPRTKMSAADLQGTLAQINDAAPIIHMAHEPDLFTQVPDRVSLTLSGHTHGGQVRIAGYSPVSASNYGNRFAYGHVVEGGRHLLVSGGLGCSIYPVRFGVPPEINLVELGT